MDHQVRTLTLSLLQQAYIFQCLLLIAVTFVASIGISDITTRDLLPFVTAVSPSDLTNFNASRLGSTISLSPVAQVPNPDSNPPNTFKWTVNGTTLNPTQNNRFTISSSNGRLTISGGQLADEGQYQFFISNEFGAMFSNKVGLKFSGKLVNSTFHIFCLEFRDLGH